MNRISIQTGTTEHNSGVRLGSNIFLLTVCRMRRGRLMPSMRIRLFLVSVALALADSGGAWQEESITQVQVAIALLQQGPAGRLKAYHLAKSASPSRGSRLQVRISALSTCDALIVGFNASGQVAYSDQPLLLHLTARDEQQAPDAAGWKWEKEGE